MPRSFAVEVTRGARAQPCDVPFLHGVVDLQVPDGRTAIPVDRPGEGPPTMLRGGPDEIRTRTSNLRRVACYQLHHGPTAATDGRSRRWRTHVPEEREVVREALGCDGDSSETCWKPSMPERKLGWKAKTVTGSQVAFLASVLTLSGYFIYTVIERWI